MLVYDCKCQALTDWYVTQYQRGKVLQGVDTGRAGSHELSVQVVSHRSRQTFGEADDRTTHHRWRRHIVPWWMLSLERERELSLIHI